MLYTCCNSSRNTWQRCCNGCGNTTNTTTSGNCCGCNGWGNTTNTNGCGTNALTNGVYGIFFPISTRQCYGRRTATLDCGNAVTWTNTTNGGCGCGCRQNLCTANTSSATINGDAYYARQYGLTNSGCGCGCGCSTWCGV